MENPPTILTQAEREQLLAWLDQQAQQGPKSLETSRYAITDGLGQQWDLGGDAHGVIVGQDGVPRIINEQQLRLLDCGHVISLPAQGLWVCSYGHIHCHRHEQDRCSQCKRILCDFDLQEKDGNPICPDCNRGIFRILLDWVLGR